MDVLQAVTFSFHVLVAFNMLELQSHVCSKSACCCGCAHAMICLILKKGQLTMCVEARDLPSDRARQAGTGMGGLLDLSCQPFTHNVSFMNVSCADLILFRAE